MEDRSKEIQQLRDFVVKLSYQMELLKHQCTPEQITAYEKSAGIIRDDNGHVIRSTGLSPKQMELDLKQAYADSHKC